jgi:hypothetical protein
MEGINVPNQTNLAPFHFYYRSFFPLKKNKSNVINSALHSRCMQKVYVWMIGVGSGWQSSLLLYTKEWTSTRVWGVHGSAMDYTNDQ